jgi:hypothetical protein
MSAAATPMGSKAGLMLNIFDGARQPFDSSKNILVYVADGYQKRLIWQDYKGPDIDFTVPFYNNDGGDNYSVVVSADGYYQSGYMPVPVTPAVHQAVSLMLVPKDGSFHFAHAKWADVQSQKSTLANILNASAGGDASGFYTEGVEAASTQPKIACLLNIATALQQINLPSKTPLDYIRSIFIDDLRQDRFFALADPALLDQVTLAAHQGHFDQQSGADLLLHAEPPYGPATSSFKQNQFGEANVQLTFHGQQDGLIVVEPDIDYYKSLLAHTIFELIPNGFTGGLSDPRVVYVLRWIAGGRAGIPEFDPLYTIE